MNAVKSPILLYTEQTPNPESLKFVTNRMIYANKTADFREEELATEWSPLAKALFQMPFVKGVYIANNFISITKEFNYDWEDIMLKVKNFLKEYLDGDGEVVKEGFEKVMLEQAKESYDFDASDEETALKIKDLIDTYVKPAVEMDGGNIEFKGYRDGVVYVIMQGSCSGCPSSSVTLKAGIEGMLKRMVPEVKDVVQEMG